MKKVLLVTVGVMLLISSPSLGCNYDIECGIGGKCVKNPTKHWESGVCVGGY